MSCVLPQQQRQSSDGIFNNSGKQHVTCRDALFQHQTIDMSLGVKYVKL